MLRRLYRPGKHIHWDVVEKETIDEIIFRTTKVRNRLILELMARGGMRVGEVLKLTPRDVNDQNLTIQSPKRGKDTEGVFRQVFFCLRNAFGATSGRTAPVAMAAAVSRAQA